MQRIDLLGTVGGARFGVALDHAVIVAQPGGFRVMSDVTRETVVLGLPEGGTATVTGFQPHPGGGRIPVTVDGVAGSILPEALAAARAAGGQTSVGTHLGPVPQATMRVELLAVDTGAATFVYAARPAGTGLATFRIEGGALVPVATVADAPGLFASGISGMVAVQAGTQTFLYAGSATEHGLTGWTVAPDGTLGAPTVLGMDSGLPVQGVSALRTVELGGTDYLIAAAAGSSSLTVLRVGADGLLTPVDQVIDDLGTRFQGVSTFDVAVAGDRAYVLAAGADDGLTLFALLPDGRLVHLQTLPDSAAASLANVTAIEMAVVGSEIQVLVASGAEAGLTQLRIPLAGAGAVIAASAPVVAGGAGHDLIWRSAGAGTLEGGAGDDLLVDGPGQDVLIGGTGADIFVLTADGQRDEIRDFNPGQDRIDLSAWPFLRNTGQLAVTPTPTGAILTFGDEVLEIRTHDDRPLTEAQVRALALIPVTRVAIEPVTSGAPGAGGALRVTGTAQADQLQGGPGADTLEGLAGNDTLVATAGADVFLGGPGIDLVSYALAPSGVLVDMADPSRNTGLAAGHTWAEVEGLIGSPHADDLVGDALANLMFGGDGNDLIQGRAGNDHLFGGLGNDTLRGDDGNDTLEGGAGNDNLAGGDGNDLIFGGDGHDNMGGSYGNDSIWGGAGNDTIGAGAGDDVAWGEDGDDFVSGGAGNDTLYGGAGNDGMSGSFGSDLMEGGPGDDNMGGGFGRDTLFGGSGNDTIGAGPDDDLLYGLAGNDFLAGGPGNDRLFGGDGNDRLNGGDGNDVLTGGAGADVFVFTVWTAGESDRITDFENGIDRIQLPRLPGATPQAKFAALEIALVDDNGVAATRIQYGGQSILLTGVAPAALDPGDFLLL